MSQTAVFRKLGAPLANARWSLGSVRAADGAVILKVWHDQVKRLEGATFARVSYRPEDSADPDLGHAERQKHIDSIRNGASSYLIVCRAVDPAAVPREVASVIDTDVFPGGRLIEVDGETYLEVLTRIPLQQAMASA